MTDAEDPVMCYRPGLVLSVAWRLLTELFRRHGAAQDLRLLRSHPGNSVSGQLKLLINPRGDELNACPQLVLNLGGPVGMFSMYVNGVETTAGDFLTPTLAGDLAGVLSLMEQALGLRAPTSLPSSTPTELAMRLVSEVLTATWLDRQDYGIETAWLDWSGGSRVLPWAVHLGFDVAGLQASLEIGRLEWGEVYLQVSALVRLGVMKDGILVGRTFAFDMRAGTIVRLDDGKAGEPIDIRQSYSKHGRRLEPLVAQLLMELRRGS